MMNADIADREVTDMDVHIHRRESMLQKVMRMNASTVDPEAMDMDVLILRMESIGMDMEVPVCIADLPPMAMDARIPLMENMSIED